MAKIENQIRDIARMKITIMMAGTLMVVAGCATTDPVESAADTAASNVTAVSNESAVASKAKGANDRDTVRCKRMVVTGSRVGKSVCHTEEQWAAIKKQSEELMDELNSERGYQGRAQ